MVQAPNACDNRRARSSDDKRHAGLRARFIALLCGALMKPSEYFLAFHQYVMPRRVTCAGVDNPNSASQLDAIETNSLVQFPCSSYSRLKIALLANFPSPS